MIDVPIPDLAANILNAKRFFDDAFNGIADKLGQPVSAFRAHSFGRPLAEWFGRFSHFLYLRMREMASQATPWDATGANLDAWLEFYKVQVPAAQTAVLSIELESDGSIVVLGGITLPAGTEFAASGTGIYTLDAPINFPAGAAVTRTGTVTAEAVGSVYNLAPGDQIALASPPISGIVDPGVVTGIVTAGLDTADDADKQQLLRDALTGGKAVGTIAWYQGQLRTLDTGIGEVFVHAAGLGDGTVALYPLLRPAENQPAYTIIKPTAGQAAGWTAVLNDTSVQVTNHVVTVDELRTPTIDLEATILPDTAATRAAAVEAVALRFAEEWPSGARGMQAYQIANSEIAGAIATAQGITTSSLVSVAAGAGAGADNVPSPGPDADVYAQSGQVLVSNISFS